MKNISQKTFLVLLFSGFLSAQGQNCKPDFQGTDKISHQSHTAWDQEIFETKFVNRMINSAGMMVKVKVGRYGNTNVINLLLINNEGNVSEIGRAHV